MRSALAFWLGVLVTLVCVGWLAAHNYIECRRVFSVLWCLTHR